MIASGFIVTFDNLTGPWKGVCEGLQLGLGNEQLAPVPLLHPPSSTCGTRFLALPACLSSVPKSRRALRASLSADYANPVSYFLQALVVNEFESDNWGGPAPDGSAVTAGEYFMQQRGGPQHRVWAQTLQADLSACMDVAIQGKLCHQERLGPSARPTSSLLRCDEPCLYPPGPSLFAALAHCRLLHRPALDLDWHRGVGLRLHPAEHTPLRIRCLAPHHRAQAKNQPHAA
jgi:hypothetical protein